MDLRINTSKDWDDLEPYVRKHLRTLSKSNEAYKIIKNFNNDIKELARLEWEERLHKKSSSKRANLVDKINRELLELDKLLVLGTLYR